MSKEIRFTVTGATGFIGQALCSELSRQGFVVRAYARKGDFKALPRIEYTYVQSYLEIEGNPDAVCVHLAGESSISAAGGQTERALTDAVALAQYLCTQHFAKVIFASSGVVYGDRSGVPHREEEPVNISGAYARLKSAVEEVILERQQTVARIANTYGLGMSKKNVFSDILGQLGDSGPVKVRNTASVRDFIHVSDVCHGLICLATGKQPGILNFGTGIGTSIADLATQMLDIAGQGKRGISCEEQHPYHSRIILDSSKMKVRYGWKPRVELREGLKELVAQARMDLHV